MDIPLFFAVFTISNVLSYSLYREKCHFSSTVIALLSYKLVGEHYPLDQPCSPLPQPN